MMEYRIRYNIKKARLSGILGICFVIIGILSYIYASYNMHIFTALGITNIAIGAYYLKVPYARTDVKYARVGLSKMKIDEVRRVKYFAGDVTISNGKREMSINKDMVDPSSMADLENFQAFLEQKCASNAIIG